MQLSLHADYALRVLIYLGSNSGGVSSTQEMSEAYGISKHHLVRVVQTLGREGLVDVLPGRTGGVRLAQDPASIRLGDIVRLAEPHMRLVECFDPETNTCPIVRACSLRGMLQHALDAFITTLNGYTLADILDGDRGMRLASTFIALHDVGGRQLSPSRRS